MIDDFTLPNYKMKDCQTVKYDWLVCKGAGEDCLIDLLGGAGSWENSDWFIEQREFARRMHEVQGTGMLELLALGTLGKVYYCRQPAGVQTQPLFPSFYLYFSTSLIL